MGGIRRSIDLSAEVLADRADGSDQFDPDVDTEGAGQMDDVVGI